jgi:hypothetical protein
MPTKRDPTKSHVPDWTLSEQQRTAVDLIVSGRNLQDTADAVGVQRWSVSQWVNHHPGFRAALNERRRELWADLVDGLRALAPKAVQVLAEALEGEASVSAAIHVLKICGFPGVAVVPTGAVDPRMVAAEMETETIASLPGFGMAPVGQLS